MKDSELLNMLDIFVKEKNSIIDCFKKERKKLIPKINVIETCLCKDKEIYNTKLLAEMLRINFLVDDINYNKEINFARDFSDFIIKDKLHCNNINTNNDININTEVLTKNNRKIDLLIHNKDFEIIVENKINSYELENQLEDYYNDRLNHIDKDRLFVVLLTKYGYEAYSLNDQLKNKLEHNNKICYLSHNDIASFIDDNIFNNYDFLKEDYKYISIYSALIQIRDNEKNICNKTQEYDMEKTIIEDFFNKNKVYESLNSIKDIEEYSKLLLDASNVIKARKIEISPIREQIEIINDIIKYLKNHGFENDNIRYLDEKIFKENIINNDTASSIPITINVKNNLNIILFINMNCCYVSIFSNSNNIIDKLAKKDIKEEIIKIFNVFELREGKNDPDPLDYLYVYYFYINADDKADEIANVIINTYNYLKNLNL